MAGVELAGLLGFVVVSHSRGEGLLRFLPLLVGFALIACLPCPRESCGTKAVVRAAVMAAVIVVFVVQLLGFSVYPGLAKDLEFLSEENGIRAALMLLSATAGNVLLLLLARSGRVCLRSIVSNPFGRGGDNGANRSRRRG